MQCPFGSRRSVRPKPKPGVKVQSPAYRLETSSLQVSAPIHSNFTIQHPNIWHQNERATTQLPPSPTTRHAFLPLPPPNRHASSPLTSLASLPSHPPPPFPVYQSHRSVDNTSPFHKETPPFARAGAAEDTRAWRRSVGLWCVGGFGLGMWSWEVWGGGEVDAGSIVG